MHFVIMSCIHIIRIRTSYYTLCYKCLQTVKLLTRCVSYTPYTVLGILHLRYYECNHNTLTCAFNVVYTIRNGVFNINGKVSVTVTGDCYTSIFVFIFLCCILYTFNWKGNCSYQKRVTLLPRNVFLSHGSLYAVPTVVSHTWWFIEKR